MQTFSFFILIFALFSIACNAAPISPFKISSNYDARDSEVVDLSARTLRPVGPGGRHPEDDPGHASYSPASGGFHPMPHGTYVETHNRVYSADEVNAHAQRFTHSILPGADTKTSNKQKKSTRTYPKPTSGFRPSEAHRDPAAGYDLAYHYPMKGAPGNAPVNAHTGKTSMKVGTDRLMAWRNRGDQHHNIAVSYHDPHQPIPLTSSNHPFSVAPVKTGSAAKIYLLKVKKAIQRTWRKVAGRSH
ncbi:hypothetical protein HYPSUDRAFT_46826 [Hypholoma sublateritium FD-334 SS-4]|uniref:Uncharacterized protein n=1 Tax=Hypholoma sublateritium (strain FD-334 SS-4) TaxID=945553 RepID=A0A0D2NCU8_HYPSF|nr:hypothetical protein HYPSUDRAFT_46826 [Hypholoma sublateritium FD-334 SS-4]